VSAIHNCVHTMWTTLSCLVHACFRLRIKAIHTGVGDHSSLWIVHEMPTREDRFVRDVDPLSRICVTDLAGMLPSLVSAP
jgi:hypothetical protein